MTTACRTAAILVALVLASGCLTLGETADSPDPSGSGGKKDGGISPVDAWAKNDGDSSDADGADSTSDGPSDAAGDASSIGCSDGTREGYLSLAAEPDIAGCSGGFSVPGVLSDDSRQLKCAHNAGNTSPNPNGIGCSVADLCAEGWHVCEDNVEFEAKVVSNTCPTDMPGDYFFATRQRMTIKPACTLNLNEWNNVVGCGKASAWADATDQSMGCGLLDTMLKLTTCDDSNGVWECPGDGNNEGLTVKKTAPELGGVLCCRG